MSWGLFQDEGCSPHASLYRGLQNFILQPALTLAVPTAMTLDIFTLLLVLALGNLVMAGALWLALGGKSHDGLAKWQSSLITQTAAWCLFASHTVTPGSFVSSLAHLLLAGSLMLQMAAVREYQQVWAVMPSPSRLCLLCLPPIAAALSNALLYSNESFRVSGSNLLQALCCIAVAWQIMQDAAPNERQRRLQVLMAASFGSLALVFLARSLISLTAPELMGALNNPGSAQGVTFLAATAVVIINSFGFLLMHKTRAEDEMHKLATMDPLTGVFNRRTFIELAERELARCRRSGSPLCLLMMDLDHFKRVNDTRGHMVGDDVLREFARAVTGCLRREDLLVRYGGEEFCVLLPGADAATAKVLAERIRAFVDHNPMTTRAGPVHVTTSVGVCGDDATRIDSLDSLLSCADRALYLAKGGGRNRCIEAAFTSAIAAHS